MNPNIRVYTQKRCAHCSILKRMLTDMNINYEEVNIDAKSMAYIFSKDLSIISTPILEIDDELYIYDKICTPEKLTNVLISHDVTIEKNN